MKRFFTLLTMLSFVFVLYGQDRTITGTVTDVDSGEPLPGVSIVLQGTSTGVITDLDGNYSINSSDGQVLVFSFVGYLNEEITISGQDKIDVALVTDIQSLDEVVVIGYGTQKKSLVTGAISQVGSEEIESQTVTRVEQALQGRAAGVYVATNSGEPGGGLSVKIRGNSSDGANDPIYIVDGVRTGGLDYLNPSDIESVEILKDAASAAIYGAEGGNGVVLITTKKGEKGQGVVNYKFSYGIQKAVNLPSIMNASQYQEYFVEASEMEGSNPARFENLDVTNGTDWLDEIFVDAPMREHQLSFSGGGEKTTYYMSLSSLDQDGIVGGSKNNLNRYTFRSNVESQVKDWLSVGINASYSHTKKLPLPTTDQYGGIVTTAFRYDPTTPLTWKTEDEIPAVYLNANDYRALVKHPGDGTPYAFSDFTVGEMWNPAAKIAYQNSTDITDKILADFHLNFHPVDWLKFTSRFFVDYAYGYNHNFLGKTMFGIGDKITHDTATKASETYNKWFKYGTENYLTFDKTFGQHQVTAMVGMSYEDYQKTWMSATGYNIRYGNIDYGYPNLGQDDERNEISGYAGDEYQEIDLRASYFGRVSYNYAEKYLLQGSVRRDGLSKFGPDEKWAVFPAFSLGWNIHKESFFGAAAENISNLKLRYSWGKNGAAQVLGPFPYVTTLNVVDYPDGTLNGALQTGQVPGAAGNNALRWEENIQTNIGVDLGMFRNALTVSLEYFNRKTSDQLADKSDLPIYLGFTAAGKVNDGEVTNKGWEFSASYKGNISDLNYTVFGNASYLKNEVTKFGVEGGKEGGGIGQLGNVSKYEVGQPVWYFNGYQAIGVFQNEDDVTGYINDSTGTAIQPRAIPGDVKYADLNGNGTIDAGDREFLGKPLPDWYYGFGFNLEYKGFDLQAFFQGTVGSQVFWAPFRNDNLLTNRSSVWYEERWTGEGTSNKYPRATSSSDYGNYRVSSLNVHDADYLRLKTLSIGYTLPNSITSKAQISKLKIFYTGTNLLTFTKYPGTDPEVGNARDSWEAAYLGVDNGNYPSTQVHTVGVQVSF